MLCPTMCCCSVFAGAVHRGRCRGDPQVHAVPICRSSLPGGFCRARLFHSAYNLFQDCSDRCLSECYSFTGLCLVQVPYITTVAVEIRKCMKCLSYGWACDNWRETMVFNFNNYCLVEVSVLYRCLDEFVGGRPIETFFAHLLQPLTTNACWLLKNRYLGMRYDTCYTYLTAHFCFLIFHVAI